MSSLRRLVLLRHGETVGRSSVRFHGRTDVALSDEGRTHAHAARLALRDEFFDLVVASPLQRAWESARIVTGGAPLQLERGFREVDFGRWEGLTAEEIQALDPGLYDEWQERGAGFEYPGGEPRAAFRQRVLAGLARIEGAGATHVLVVAHKGVIRIVAEQLLGAPLEDGGPELGGLVGLARDATGAWFVGRNGRGAGAAP